MGVSGSRWVDSQHPNAFASELATQQASPILAQRGERADQRALPAFWRGHVGGNSRDPS